jgi:hypothetical protein
VLRALLERVLIESVGEMHTRHAILFHMVRSDLSVHAAKAWLLVVRWKWFALGSRALPATGSLVTAYPYPSAQDGGSIAVYIRNKLSVVAK